MSLNDHGSSSGLEPFPEPFTPPPPPQVHSDSKTENGAPVVVDAGLKGLDHYKRALPTWRYTLRQRLLPLVRWETPYLAMIQSKMRTPALDSYFAITANLGTHTFFMIMLPILFWCGFWHFGKGLVHILALGVFFSGFIKDLCSLPRPLSPPLQRITMSGHVALEYGFPSTHSANAISVVVYAVLLLRSERNIFSPAVSLAIEALTYFYAVSIVFGRLYCGMHGFLDVLFGSLIGALISLGEFYYAPPMEEWLHASSWVAPALVAAVVIVLVRVHPEPADDCPCFDDSVAFAGVMIGLEFGGWHLANSAWRDVFMGPGAVVVDIDALGWPTATARVVVGVLIIFAWREVMKPALLFLLPHLFRVIEKGGLSLPRRFFVPASEYKDVPLHVRDDNVMPNVSDIPRMVRSIRGPGRGRAVSIGPQSAADAYETLAYRERKRRESLGSDGGAGPGVRSKGSLAGLREKAAEGTEEDQNGRCEQASGVQQSQSGRVSAYEQMMGQGVVAGSSPDRSLSPEKGTFVEEPELYPGQGDELGEKEMFSKLVKPRVRYDVEVVTKLVVYAGIAMFAVDFIPIILEFIGLGIGHLPVRS